MSNLAPSVSSRQLIAFMLDQIDDADEIALDADRQLQHQRHGAEPVVDHLDAAREIGADAVHLVDEADARHAVFVGLAPHGLGLRLDAGDANRTPHRAVEHAQASARPRW